MRGSSASVWSFFLRRMSFGIALGNPRARFAETEAELTKQTLALTHPQVDSVLLLDPGTQRLAIPDIAVQPDLPRRAAKNRVYPPQLLGAQPTRPTRSLAFHQARQPAILKALHPTLDGPDSVAQQARAFRTCHALCHQQDPMQAVVVARFLRSSNFILQSQNDVRRIGNGQWFHAPRKPQLFRLFPQPHHIVRSERNRLGYFRSRRGAADREHGEK